MARTGIRSSAIVIKDKKILLIHRKKDGDEYWTFPGGGVEEGESAKKAAVREVMEETGLKVESLHLAFMNQTFEGGNEHPFYFCRVGDNKAILGGEEKEKNSKENFYKLEWISLSELNKFNLVPENAKQKVIEMYAE